MPSSDQSPTNRSKWAPSRKWYATLVTALAALLTAWVTAGAWDKTLSIALIGLVGQSVIGYLVPNAGDQQPPTSQAVQAARQAAAAR